MTNFNDFLYLVESYNNDNLNHKTLEFNFSEKFSKYIVPEYL